ncbi:MAG: FMN-dependent NADH-azoreductase [Dermatophilaceae bacterium]
MSSSPAIRVLRIDSSARYADSVSRTLTARLTDRLAADGATVTVRDLGGGVPVVDELAVGAYFTAPHERSAAQVGALATSDELVAELVDADVLVVGAPMYNFTIPASLKAYFDLVARAGVTFDYTEAGPAGRLAGKRAVVVISTAGVEVGSATDFASGYVRQFLGFLGITDVQVVAADLLLADPTRLDRAERDIDTVAAA